MTFDMRKAYADLHNNGIEIRTTLAAALDEIKRLQEENESQKTDYILMNKRYEEYIGGPGEDVKLLKDQIAKWQQIAIEERAKATYYLDDWSHFGEDFQLIKWENAKTSIQDHYLEQAAKELGLQIEQEASYVKRLEEKISDFYECDATRRGCCRQVAQDQARAALVKIREGKE